MGNAAGVAGAEGGELSTFAARIRACAPDLALDTLRLNPDGLTNHVVIVNEEWVCYPIHNRSNATLNDIAG